ncbi:calcium-binding protein [Paenibacillus periandrae]|uniref:calcium-binding protein n=1 Tax=Paenibacillus periandrae TaxID=1761741 RepID=UPI001F09A000|nr:calcium-binding protein [Paenibacillus periandrae]
MIEPWERRVADILGVELEEEDVDANEEESSSLPQASNKTLEIYHRYLSERLSFPFAAVFEQETGPFDSITHQVKVIGLEEDYDDFYGLLCEVKEGRKKRIVELDELRVEEKDPNYKLIDDYSSWFCNYR